MSFYKYITSDDRVVSTTDLTQVVSNLSSSGGSFPPSVIKRDYYLEAYSGSTNHIYDITVGRSYDMGNGVNVSGSGLSAAIKTDVSRSVSIYNQMAKVLLGTDADGNILKFSKDTNESTTDNIMHAAYFVNLPRNNINDKIKAGSFSMEVLVSGTTNTVLADKRTIVLADISGATGPTKKQCASGEFGMLYAVPATGSTIIDTTAAGDLYVQGLVFYEAGIAVISPSIFAKYNASFNIPTTASDHLSASVFGILPAATVQQKSLSGSYTGNIADIWQSQSLTSVAETLSTRILTASYQSVTELNSTIYFCRAFNSEFNYSSNPTYLSSSEIRVKGGDPLAQPVSYITTVGLYDDKNQLLAVAKLSEPVKKTPETELIARVRLDF